MQSPVLSPALQRAANVSTGELLRALMATVGDLSTSVAQANAQMAQTTQHMQAVAELWAHIPYDGGGAMSLMVNRRGLMGWGM